MTTTYLSWCERIDGPNWKQGYTGIPTRTLGNIKGEVKHSAEGSYAALLAALNNPSRIASWHFSVSKSGHVAQHYPLESVCWHAGDMAANIKYVGIEHEGVVGEPLTTAQVLATVHLSLDIRRFAGITANPQRRVNLWEHNELSSTACPSHRIQWLPIIVKIMEEEMALTADDKDYLGGLMRGNVQATGNGVMNSPMRRGDPDWVPPVTLNDVIAAVAALSAKVDAQGSGAHGHD